QRHATICTKLKKRKPFDSSKQRLDGIVPSEIKRTPTTDRPTKSKKNNWKEKHEDFLYTIRSARGVTAAIKEGRPLPPPPPAAVNPDYVQCPHCNRRFNEHSAERHIDFCKEQKSRIGKSPATAAASRVAARTQYKPPTLSKRNSTGVIPASKTRQTLRKTTNDTAEYKPSKYDNQPLPSKNQATKPQSASSPTKSGRQRSVGVSSAGTTRTTTKTNGHTATATQYSNRYKSKDNYMEILDNDNEKLVNKTRDVRHGRRASKPRSDSLDDLPSTMDKATHQETTQTTRRNITIRDPSPTLFDDFDQRPKPTTTNKKHPFPSKAQVHRPGDGHRTDTDGPKRLSKFCYECGTKYPVAHAKFCCECGTKRPLIES
ncbi:hypothetical protein QZH41_009031, partial [Actinostola sp. cb2023]